jgi:hypothetical protein
VVIALIPAVTEPPELFQLKCPSRTLKVATHLNRKTRQSLGSSPIKPLTKDRIPLVGVETSRAELGALRLGHATTMKRAELGSARPSDELGKEARLGSLWARRANEPSHKHKSTL